MPSPRPGAFLACALALLLNDANAAERPDVILIYTDDVGYGDISCQGGLVPTPNIDSLAADGLRFRDGHAAAATCTPSRYALLTGRYAWRQPGTGVLPGDAPLIVPDDRPTLASVLRDAGYATAVVGKWHLGLGRPGRTLDWNGPVAPGPLELGFETCFLIPATGDRVPCVYVKDRAVFNLDPRDPIRVSYRQPVGDEPTGRDRPDLLKQRLTHGHDQTIVNGVSRIGYMTGGAAARWVDEDMADDLVREALRFLETAVARNPEQPVFLYFSTHDIHVPRVPHPRFAGKTPFGPRGDAILQTDWCVGRILETLRRLGRERDALVVFTSDNGPVLDDGYADDAPEKIGDHRPAGPWRGGKYSAFEAGTRVPFLVRWPARVKPGVSDALVSQVDLLPTLAKLVSDDPDRTDAALADLQLDGRDILPALLGESQVGRTEHVAQAAALSLRRGNWKYIEPNPRGPARSPNTGVETGNSPQPQLYDLAQDPGETRNLAEQRPEILAEMRERLRLLREAPRPD